MAKKTKKPKWTRAEKRKTKRKSKSWWVSLDGQCKPGCEAYERNCEVELCFAKPIMYKRTCGCVRPTPTSDHMMMSLAQYRNHFANAPELEPGGPPVRVRLRMEVV